MMRGFQISSQNLNRVTFNPPLGQKWSKWQSRVFCQFLSKSCQVLSDLNSETRLRVRSSFHNFFNPICKDFHTLIFWPNIVTSKTFNSIGTNQNQQFWEYKLYHVDKPIKKHQKRGSTWRHFKKNAK